MKLFIFRFSCSCKTFLARSVWLYSDAKHPVEYKIFDDVIMMFEGRLTEISFFLSSSSGSQKSPNSIITFYLSASYLLDCLVLYSTIRSVLPTTNYTSEGTFPRCTLFLMIIVLFICNKKKRRLKNFPVCILYSSFTYFWLYFLRPYRV